MSIVGIVVRRFSDSGFSHWTPVADQVVVYA
jgi:hypothetical protein